MIVAGFFRQNMHENSSSFEDRGWMLCPLQRNGTFVHGGRRIRGQVQGVRAHGGLNQKQSRAYAGLFVRKLSLICRLQCRAEGGK